MVTVEITISNGGRDVDILEYRISKPPKSMEFLSRGKRKKRCVEHLMIDKRRRILTTIINADEDIRYHPTTIVFTIDRDKFYEITKEKSK